MRGCKKQPNYALRAKGMAGTGALQDKRGTQKGRQRLNSDLAVVGWRETRIGGRDKLSSKLHARLLSACEGFVSKGEIQPFERF